MSFAAVVPSLFSPSRHRALLALALFLAIWGTKLALIERFGTDLPFWDQWSKEGEQLYPAWFERGEIWRNLFIPHNEHRIAPTLVLNFGLVLASGQWDARVQCIISGGLHALVLTGLFLRALRRLPYPWALGAGGLLATIGIAPIAWENLFGGIQSSFYFLLGFSVLAMGNVLLNAALSTRWWMGIAAGACALFSMGSGFLWALVVVVMGTMRLLNSRAPRRDAVASILAGAIFVGLGLWLHTSVAGHEPLHAKSPGMFIVYALRCLSWPLVGQPWLAMATWLPWVWLLTLRIRSGLARTEPREQTAAIDFVLALGFWVLSQAAAVAYSRAGTGQLPASRYGDVFAVGLVANVFTLALLRARVRYLPALTSAWGILIGISLSLAALPAWRTALPNKKADHVAFERNVRQFVLTNDDGVLENQVLPFPNAGWLARILRQRSVREILPTSVHAPLRIDGFEKPKAHTAPDLPNQPTRALMEPGEWRSAPLPTGSGWWKIETAGDLGESGTSLTLVAVSSGRTLDDIAPSKLPGNAWRAAYVSAPREPAVLVARVDRPDRWFAFSTPTEMSALSFAAWRLGRSGWLLGIGGMTVGLALALIQSRRMCKPEPGKTA